MARTRRDSLAGDALDTIKPDAINSDIHKSNTTRGARAKEKAIQEFKLYWIVFFFLALMFGAFTTYRRLILGEVGVSYGHYGAGLIEAAVIAKVLLIGEAMKIGHRMEEHPLVLSVLVKSVLFGLFVGVFNIIEHIVEGLFHHETWQAVLSHPFKAQNMNELLARAVVMMVTFIPFFALWETSRVLGPGKLSQMFLHRRPA